jgi:hypothetical protein
MISTCCGGCYPAVTDQITETMAISNSPCNDLEFQLLKTKPIEQMTQREFELYKMKEQACINHKTQVTASAQVAKGAAHTGDVTIGLFVGSCIAAILVTLLAQAK